MAAEHFPVEATHILMFARAIADTSPELDLLRAESGPVIAPPTFTAAAAQFDPDYPLRPVPGEPWIGSGREATGLKIDDQSGSGSGLHAEQHFVYHRPVVAGDVLTARIYPGKQWEKEGRRGGKLMFSETITEYRNQDGELVVTSTSVGVRTERTPGDAPA